MAVVLHVRSNSIDNVKRAESIHVETKKMRDSAEKTAHAYTIGSCVATQSAVCTTLSAVGQCHAAPLAGTCLVAAEGATLVGTEEITQAGCIDKEIRQGKKLYNDCVIL